MKISLYNISKEETSIIKLIAIISITIHNFIAWTVSVDINEMQFSPQNIWDLFHFCETHLLRIPDALFTYFGHYGVEIFIFMSGYGLTKMFLKNPPVSYKSYIFTRVKKLYSLLFIGIIFCFFFYFDDLFLYMKRIVFLSLTMMKNISYRYLFTGVGPWWYFSLALQLYILFPFLYKLIINKGKKAFFVLLLISYTIIYLFLPLTERLNFPMFGNFIGHLPEFMLGISLACIKDFRITWGVVILSAIVFVLSNFFEAFYPLSFLSVTILAMSVLHLIIKPLPYVIKKPLIHAGKISMFIFLINGPIRVATFPFLIKYLSMNAFLASIIHLFVVLFLSWIVSIVYKKLVSYVDKRFPKLSPLR